MRISKVHISILTTILSVLFIVPAFAEIKIFEKETVWRAAKNQNQEQAEGLAKLEAQRQAIEEAGVFISSLTAVKNYKLEKDEVTQLASGILKTKTIGEPTISIENGILCVRVKTVIQVDTSILDRQIEDFMKDKGALKREEEAMKKVRELQEQIANLKSSEVKRLEELNAQAIALEREREKQRLFREEQALKARGELSRAEAERIAKEREMQERINRTLAEQERAKREEAAALAAEQDRIRRAALENEQRWNELSRKAKLSQESWVAIDDSLSLKQAIEEVKGLKAEIANLKNRLDYQYRANIANLKNAYAQQIALTKPKMPPEAARRDVFEKTDEYNARISAYKRQVKEAEVAVGEAVEKLKKEETLKLAEAKVEYLGQQIRVLTPFVERLDALQSRKFILPEGGTMTVDLSEPDADNNRFPVRLRYNGKSWSAWWNYTDRNSARDFYRTKTYLKAEGLFQIEEGLTPRPKLTAARVTHLATKETREFSLETLAKLSEINQFVELQKEEATAKVSRKKAERILITKEIGNDGRFVAYDDGTVLDKEAGLMWAARDNGCYIDWAGSNFHCKNYRGAGYADWRMPTQDELALLYDRSITGHNRYHLTTLITLTGCCPWASDVSGSGAAFFNFMYGKRNWTLRSSDNKGGRVLPVRSAK